MPHSGQKPKNENEPKEEDDLQWKMTFDGRQSLMEDGRWPWMEGKMTLDR